MPLPFSSRMAHGVLSYAVDLSGVAVVPAVGEQGQVIRRLVQISAAACSTDRGD